jgi:glycosyltransferase involved in cell wall biosynthesis
MRVIIVADLYYPFINGIVRQEEGLAKALQNDGHDVLIVAPGRRGQPEREKRDGIDHWTLPSVKGVISPDLNIARPILLRFNKIIETWKPDVIHIQSELFIAQAAKRSAKKYRVPYLFTYHNFTYQSKGKWWRPADLAYQVYLKQLYGNKIITVPAQSTIEFLTREYGQKNYLYMPNGINMADFCQRQQAKDEAKKILGLSGKQVFIYIGRLSTEKRVIDGITGFHQVTDPNIHYVIVGAGTQLSTLRSNVAKWGDQRITFTGKLEKEQVKIYYEAADVCLFPSPVENHSIAMLEALSFGIPILGADAGGLGRTLHHGIDGLLFPPYSPDAVASSIRQYLAMTPAQRLAMSDNARALGQKFDFYNLVRQYVDLYQLVIRQGSEPATKRQVRDLFNKIKDSISI